jgi:hypothetical protein
MQDERKAPASLDWGRLLREFEAFEEDPSTNSLDAHAFALSLVRPPPDFVEAFLQRNGNRNWTREEAARALYGFLLQKRYEEKLNLLHFAFHIFDERTQLPQDIIDQTPFPHEDGVPAFRHFQEPGFALDPSGS